MAEKYLINMAENIRNLIPGDMSVENNDTSIVISGDMNVGVKGINVNIDLSVSTIKIKGAREYKYPIADAAVDEFQNKMLEKHQGYSIYVSGQTLNFSKFCSYQEEKEVMDVVQDAISAMQDVVTIFENDCVNFLEKNPDVAGETQDNYDPEKNVELVNVDNSFQAVTMSEKDNESYDIEHNEFTIQTFLNLGQKLNAHIVNDGFSVSKGEKTLFCNLFREDNEIMVAASIPVSRDVGAMYISYIAANYPELISSYKADEEKFIVRTYATPDKYSPDETEELLNRCEVAVDACVHEYEQTLTKKDSAGFASDVQQILSEQTETLAAKESEIAEKEQQIKEHEEWLYEKERQMEQQIAEIQKEKESMQYEIEQERERIQAKEKEMQEKISEYEERNTKDILNIQQLANQVASLQNKQKMLGQDNNQSDEELLRLRAKVQQLTGQKIVLEKKLTEKITNRDSKIRELSDTISEKEREFKKLESNIDDMVKSRVSEESKKTESYVKKLEKSVAEIGHILTPEELIEYLKQFNSDTEYKKAHGQNDAKFVVFNDESLEVRVRFGDTNYVDVSKSADLKDLTLKKLNAKYGEVKFFSKENRIIARTYFKKNATAKEVDEVIESLAFYFNK